MNFLFLILWLETKIQSGKKGQHYLQHCGHIKLGDDGKHAGKSLLFFMKGSVLWNVFYSDGGLLLLRIASLVDESWYLVGPHSPLEIL